MWAHDTPCRNETSKKTATIILQLIMPKSQEQNTKRAQNKISMHAKVYAKKHTPNICAKAQNSRMHTPKQTRPVVSTTKNPPNLKNQNFLN